MKIHNFFIYTVNTLRACKLNNKLFITKSISYFVELVKVQKQTKIMLSNIKHRRCNFINIYLKMK